MEFFYNPRSEKQSENVSAFQRIAARYEWMNFYQPNPNSPWHVQGKIPCKDGSDIVVNFWPHKGKAQRDGDRVVIGEDAIRLMISEAIDDSQDDLELFE